MKLRKTRIKKTTKANGSTTYSAEYKWGFWWYEFKEGPSVNAKDIYAYYKGKLRRDGYVYHKSEEQTKALIDFYIERVNFMNACEMENKVVKVEYEGYP